MTLYINTTDFNKVTFAIVDSKTIKRSYKINPHKSHETLAKLDEFLKSAKVRASAIKKIIVNKGPGSYTGVRVGVTHALALGFALDVPVKAIANEKFSMLK
ncbi:MAG TPA: hypothetical protein VE973_03045 [Candidatus Limnocylindria bacterium]|nr:hypothetical protein [Candidatus Limnocylindria bacterium]